MKKLVLLALAACAAVPALAQPNVGVSIGIAQPGVYGRINIGNLPPPPVVYPQPVVVAPPPVVVPRQPIYLYVPPAYQRNWRVYCSRYSACNQPVYFVQEQWVRERWEREHGPRGHGPRGHGPRDPHWDRHDRGHGPGHGHGRGRGHDRHGD